MGEYPVKPWNVNTKKIIKEPEQRNVNIRQEPGNTSYKYIVKENLSFVFQQMVADKVKSNNGKQHMDNSLRHFSFVYLFFITEFFIIIFMIQNIKNKSNN